MEVFHFKEKVGFFAYSGLQLRKSEQNGFHANFLISQPNPMMLPLIGIVSERRFQ